MWALLDGTDHELRRSSEARVNRTIE